MDALTDEWIAYTYDQPNRRAVQWEWWFHRAACRQWFLVRRDTRTNQVLESAMPGEVATGTHDQEQLGETEAKSVHANLSELARECFDLDISHNFDT